MKSKRKTVSTLIAAAICVSLISGCARMSPTPLETPTPPPSATVLPTPTVQEEPVIFECIEIDENFNPFFAETDGDRLLMDMTQANILTLDDNGEVVYKAIEGEARTYEGKAHTYKGPADISVTQKTDGGAVYRIELSPYLKFSDGEEVNADDLIFSYYVLCDPSYTGRKDLDSAGILGLNEYRTQASNSVYDKYEDIFDDAFIGHNDFSDSAMSFVKKAWIDDVESIVNYCVDNYIDDSESYTGYSSDKINSSGMEIMFAMVMWSYGNIDENGALVSRMGKTWDLVSNFPTLEDFYNEFEAEYAGDCVRYWEAEGADYTDVYSDAKNRFIEYWADQDPEYKDGIKNIAGIRKVDQRTIEITTIEYSEEAIHYVCNIPIVPLHFYGNENIYNYAENKFGFVRGDLEAIKEIDDIALGAGPYKFMGMSGDAAILEPNEYYFGDEPEHEHIRIVEIE